jgi:hypothetical protein
VSSSSYTYTFKLDLYNSIPSLETSTTYTLYLKIEGSSSVAAEELESEDEDNNLTNSGAIEESEEEETVTNA